MDDRETSDDREPTLSTFGSSREVHPLRTHYALRELMVAHCVGDALQNDDEDQALAAEAGNEILVQLTQPSPEPGKIKRAVATLRGVLVPLAIAAETGVAQAVTDWAKAAIEHLSTLIS